MNIKEQIREQIVNQQIFKLRQKVLDSPCLQIKEIMGGYPINNHLWFNISNTVYNRVTIQVYNHIKNNIKC